MSEPDLSRAASYAFAAHLDARLDRCELTMPEVDRIEQGFLAGFDAACDAIRDGVIRSPMGEVVMHPPPGLVRAATGGKVEGATRALGAEGPGVGPGLHVPLPRPRFIVAEVSVNWRTGEDSAQQLLSQRFERIIAHNLELGYALHSWRLSSSTPVLAVGAVAEGMINETIVAVFERAAPPSAYRGGQPSSRASRSGIVG